MVTPTTRNIAAFDFDGTITTRDTLLGFVAAATPTSTYLSSLAHSALPLARSLVDDGQRDIAKAAMLRCAFSGMSHNELVEHGKRYASVVTPRFRTNTIDAIQHHRRMGHELVIVSASLALYLKPIAEQLRFDHVIGVELEFDDQSICTGEMVGPNVRGAEKVVRLEKWLNESGSSDSQDTEMWAYGNSSGDDELLARADHRFWIGKRAERNDHAVSHGHMVASQI